MFPKQTWKLNVVIRVWRIGNEKAKIIAKDWRCFLPQIPLDKPRSVSKPLTMLICVVWGNFKQITTKDMIVSLI